MLPNPERKRYEAKIEIISKEKNSSSMDSYKITNGWVDNISLWPTIEYGDIYNYLIDLPGAYTREKLWAN